MIDTFIFTQTSILLCTLYFSFALPDKKHRFLPLLALSLFVFGNNIAYFCVFGIFYLFLLYRMQTSLGDAIRWILPLATAFLVCSRILLFVQTLFASAPDCWESILFLIFYWEGEFIHTSAFDFPVYFRSFFGTLFPSFPIDLPEMFPCGFLWVFLLLPFAKVLRRIKGNLFPFALMTVCLFFFVFHIFYGRDELFLYAPVFMVPFFCVLAFAFHSLPRQLSLAGGSVLLLALFVFNSTGTSILSQMNEVVFGGREVIGMRVNKKTNLSQTELLRAYMNNDIGIAFVDRAEAVKKQNCFFFGIEGRRKLVFENACLKDFKTDEIIKDFGKMKAMPFPADYTVNIWEDSSAFKWNEIVENETGVFVDGILVPGTGQPVKIPDFSQYKYPLLMKALWHEIMFSIIDGVPYARLYDYFQKPKPTIWYRDIAYAGLFLEKTGRTDLIEKFVGGIETMYDMNRGHGEPDNLGQILYLQSIMKNPNKRLINEIIREARRIKDADGNLVGLTDGTPSAAYQNGWLIFALKRLGMDKVASEFNPQSSIDGGGYSRLLWFTKENAGKDGKSFDTPARKFPFFRYLRLVKADLRRHFRKSTYTDAANQPWPYIQVGMLHSAMLEDGDAWRQKGVRPILTQVTSPVSWGDDTRPHIWHAIELFFYFSEFKKTEH
jgi:hypothetical protein